MVKHPYLYFSDSSNAYGKVVGTSKNTGNGNGLKNKNIRIVQIPPVFDDDIVVEIGYYAFRWTKITSIFIPKTVLIISWGAFESTPLSEVRFEKGSRLEKISWAVFFQCHSLKRIDFPSSVKEIASHYEYKVFADCSLDCFSYQGTSSFSSVSMFNNVSLIYVSFSYQSNKFGGIVVTRDNETCNVSRESFYPKRRLCHSPNVRYQCHTNSFVVIMILFIS